MRWKGYRLDPSSPLCWMIGCQLPMGAWETWRWNCSMATTPPWPSCSTVSRSTRVWLRYLLHLAQDWSLSFIKMTPLNTGRLRNLNRNTIQNKSSWTEKIEKVIDESFCSTTLRSQSKYVRDWNHYVTAWQWISIKNLDILVWRCSTIRRLMVTLWRWLCLGVRLPVPWSSGRDSPRTWLWTWRPGPGSVVSRMTTGLSNQRLGLRTSLSWSSLSPSSAWCLSSSPPPDVGGTEITHPFEICFFLFVQNK